MQGGRTWSGSHPLQSWPSQCSPIDRPSCRNLKCEQAITVLDRYERTHGFGHWDMCQETRHQQAHYVLTNTLMNCDIDLEEMLSC